MEELESSRFTVRAHSDYLTGERRCSESMPSESLDRSY